MEVESTRLTGSLANMISPDRMTFDGNRVRVIKATMLGMGHDEEDAAVNLIASVQVKRGPMYSTITVVTHTQATPNLTVEGIRNKQAAAFADAIRSAIGGHQPNIAV